MGNYNTSHRRRPMLMLIYTHTGVPSMILGFPERVTEMLIEAYGFKGLTALRVLRPWNPMEVTKA